PQGDAPRSLLLHRMVDYARKPSRAFFFCAPGTGALPGVRTTPRHGLRFFAHALRFFAHALRFPRTRFGIVPGTGSLPRVLRDDNARNPLATRPRTNRTRGHHAFQALVERNARSVVSRLRIAVAVVGRRPRGFRERVPRTGRRDGEDAGDASARPAGDAGGPLVRGRDAELRRAPARARTAPRDRAETGAGLRLRAVRAQGDRLVAVARRGRRAHRDARAPRRAA